MKTANILPIYCTSLLLALGGIASADQTIAGNLTVQQGLRIHLDTSFGQLAQNPQLPGFRLSLSQDSTSTTQTNLITPGYYTLESVIVEDYGWLGEQNHWYDDYGWVAVPDYYPAVYDEDGNLVSEGYWGSHDDWQVTGGHWGEYNYYYGVTGTHTEQQQVWVPEVVENVTLTDYEAPHVTFNASRSDTNYDFVFPSATGSGSLWTALSIYSGGLTMTTEDTSRSFALTPVSLDQSGTGVDGASLRAINNAETTLHSTGLSWEEPGVGRHWTTNNSQLRAESLRITYRDFRPNGNTSVQTQITATSAQFGGVVTVEGNLNVKGTLRVLPAGDLGMGTYHKGLKPDGTVDNGN